MQIKEQRNTYLLNSQLTVEEKAALINSELQRLIAHFNSKASNGKRNFQIYKYSSIVLAAITSIASSLQVIYTGNFPHWILPVVSALATVAVAFLGASSAQKIWITSRTTGQQLQAEKFLFNQQAGKYYGLLQEDAIRLFSERMIQIWNEGHGKWEQTVDEG